MLTNLEAVTKEPVAVAGAVRVLVLAIVTLVCLVSGVTLTAPVVAAISGVLAAAEGLVSVLTRKRVTPNANVFVHRSDLDALDRDMADFA
jgi:hypothetical protein